MFTSLRRSFGLDITIICDQLEIAYFHCTIAMVNEARTKETAAKYYTHLFKVLDVTTFDRTSRNNQPELTTE